MIRKILERLMYGEHERKARDGEYRYMFCPHCGAFIPHRYHDPREGMKVECPECDRGAHIRPLDDGLLVDEDGALPNLGSKFADAVERADPGSRIILDEPRREIITEESGSDRIDLGPKFIGCGECGAENSIRARGKEMVCAECGHTVDADTE